MVSVKRINDIHQVIHAFTFQLFILKHETQLSGFPRRPPTVDVLQVAVHERSHAGREAGHGRCQRTHHP